jgi:hypothetical protein
MAEPQQMLLTPPELGAALKLAGVTPGHLSPVAASLVARPVSPSAVALLRQKGIVNGTNAVGPEWHAALRALGAPQSRLSIRLTAAEDFKGAEYFLGEGMVVAHAESVDGHTISFPHDLADLGSSITTWMATGALPQAPTFSDSLSRAEFTAFVALVDAYREVRLQAFLERRANGTNRFDRDLLLRQLQAGLDSRDARWLAGAVADSGPSPFELDPDLLDDGLARLESRGWIENDNSAADVLLPLVPFCESLANTLPCFSSHVDGAGARSSLLVFRGRDTFWIFEHLDAEPPAVQLVATGGAGLEGLVQAQLHSLLLRSDAEKEADQRPACSRCGAEVGLQAAFCAACGATLRAAVAQPDDTQEPPAMWAPPADVDRRFERPPRAAERKSGDDIRVDPEAPSEPSSTELITIEPEEMLRLAGILNDTRQSGRLTDDAFRRLHAAFVARDEDGSAWSVDLRFGRWIRAADNQWLAADPPLVNLQIPSATIAQMTLLQQRIKRR